ncbi:MAG: HAMP domain-containing histidine kinase [Acidobacteriota bacterium]|jgi:signal transduction histidine kinase|nr:HAMP domain-containing histidine kinase [Acidobacteriota bacterium]
MTIKRRMSVSNILMLAIPAISGLTIAAMLWLVFAGLTGGAGELSSDKGVNSEKQFYHTARKIRSLSEGCADCTGVENMRRHIDRLWLRHGDGNGENISVSLYQEGRRLYTAGEFKDSPLVADALAEKGLHYFAKGATALYMADAGIYTVILIDTDFQLDREVEKIDEDLYLINLSVIALGATLVIVFVTNRILTRRLHRSIATPLDLLTSGVRQIRDGNLEHRIAYDVEDEFASVCADFNDMAGRLRDMVEARRKDDRSRRELIAGISHDLRTPLTSIKAYAEGLEKGVTADPQKQRRYIETIQRKADDLEHLVSQLFLFSKLDIGEFPFQMAAFDMGEELAAFVAAVSGEYAERGLDIRFEGDGLAAPVLADMALLRGVFTNILENALKYGDRERALVRIGLRSADDHVTVIMSDNGSGVPEEDLEKIFSVFYRSDKARSDTGSGSGLGLAISAKIVEGMGGSIKASNGARGELAGLAICVTLPLARKG